MNRAQRQLAESILMTDQYQLTMAQLYFRQGLHERLAQFDYFFRKYPVYGSHQAGYCISAGMGSLLDWMREVRFGDEEIACLRSQRTPGGRPIFQEDFLAWLHRHGDFSAIRIQAIPEGRAVHANVPVATIEGPFALTQILETPFLNHLNYQTLIATKAARMLQAGGGRPIIEFGLRRAQGYGGNPGVRGALVGGAVASSNVGASHAFGMLPLGTHAHSMVQAFIALGDGELGAFRAYADEYPDDCLLLVDTINTLESGVPNAIRVFEELQRQGHKPKGIRLDSGDLAYLSMQAAKQLNDAGFDETTIVLSNQLDEMVIWQILSQIREEAPRYGLDAEALIQRLVFGVGTSLITSKGQEALDGVYKLAAVQKEGRWIPAIKISESPSKTLNPGCKTIWRLYDQRGKAVCDVIALDTEDLEAREVLRLHHPVERDLHRRLERQQLSQLERLLEPVTADTDFDTIGARRQQDLDRLDSGVKRLVNPHIYHVSLSQDVWDLKQQLVEERSRDRD